ncbi:MAG: hypothetical protein ACRD23_03995 [Terriglobales bacterium]
MNSDHEKRITRYLLGQLAADEQDRLERQYLADDTLFEELLAIEDELRDAYVRGELSGGDRAAFETRLLNGAHQKQQQEFARTLCRYIGEPVTLPRRQAQLAAQPRSLFQALLALPHVVLVPGVSMSILVLIVGGWWLGHRGFQPQLPSPSSEVASGTPPSTGKSPTGDQEPEAKTMAVVLSRGLVRGEKGSKPVVIPPDVSQVRLEARVEVNYPRYEAVLKTAEGKQIWSKGDLEAQAFAGGDRVILALSKNLLPPGDYILTVRGLLTPGNPETVAEYAFRIGKK